MCGLISGTAEGCELLSSSPVCDADSSTPGIQDSATAKVAQCVACKKSGNLSSYLFSILIHNRSYNLENHSIRKRFMMF